MKYIKLMVLLLVVLIISVFIFYKPSRILIPEVNGVECVTKTICTDDISRLQEAENLLMRSVVDIEEILGPLKNFPKVVFCTTQHCLENFGFKRSAASTIGRTGIIIGPRGWQPHYVKHEIIHYWQAENIGVIKMLLVDDWLIEGMAYALSDDPRPELEQPWQSHRTKFTQWYKDIDQNNLVFAINQK